MSWFDKEKIMGKYGGSMEDFYSDGPDESYENQPWQCSKCKSEEYRYMVLPDRSGGSYEPAVICEKCEHVHWL